MHKQLTRFLLFVFLLTTTTVGADAIGDSLIQLENLQMEWLAREQGRPEAKISRFTTDGCSGGLSEGWHFLSRSLPGFNSRWGDKPPWEACCVEHDRVYWQGETEHGYNKRKQADLALKACVMQLGRDKSQYFASRLSKPADEIETVFKLSADLMYQAVRVGGKPCSLLPWRWGYGWPQCGLNP
ncbi:MAG: hypothetical protein OQL06_11020 [Gammaproteobacteria bacterium]|nr:hypothetical protein [Gammaproteobacteria bacterium]